MMTPERIPANVVMGATGSGKTSFIAHLLAQKPVHDRWAVVVNDFGRVTLGDLALESRELIVREVAGCICCTAQVGLRTALVALIRSARPDRLLVEASAAAEPHSVLSILRGPGIAPAIELGLTLTVVAQHQLSDSRYAASQSYRMQLDAADVLLTSSTADDDVSAVRAKLAASGFTALCIRQAHTFTVDAMHAASRES